ncbi:unnamed protein product [Calypogeia fissa]
MASPTAETPVELAPSTSPSARSSLSKPTSTGGSPPPPIEQSNAVPSSMSPSARSSVSKRGSTGGSPALPPEQSSAGAAKESAPGSSPQPRQSIAAGVPGSPPATAGSTAKTPEGSPAPRKSVIAGAAGAPGPEAAGGSPLVPGSPTSSQHGQSPAPSTPGSAKGAVGEPAKKTPPTQGWDYSQPLPNRFFRPTLTDLCFPVLAKNFAKFPGFGNLPADERLCVVNEIALDLPLQLAADMIPEEAYWKRRVQSKWRNCDISAHGWSWKQLFFERNLAEALERFDRTVNKESTLEELIQMSAPYVHNLDVLELPSHISFLLLFNALKRDLMCLRVNFGNPDCGRNYNREKWGMKVSDCLSLSAALSITSTLTALHLSSNRIDPKKMEILAKGLMANPIVVDLDLSSNFLSDDGIREVAKVVKANNSVLGMLNLARNRITAQGCVYLAECEDVNKTLLSLNLCFNQFGDLGGKRIIDWANNNSSIQKLSLESCDIGEDSAQSFVRLMHNTHSALTSINMSGNHAIGVKNGELILTGLEAAKQMKELWINNCRCGEELERKILTFLVERLFGRTCFHHPGVRNTHLEEPSNETTKVELQKSQEEAKKKEEEDAKKEDEEKQKEEPEEEDEEQKKEREKKEVEMKAQEEAASAAAAEEKAREEALAHAEEEKIVHVGHGHDEASTLECSHMVGLPSTNPPPEPVVYPETAYASRDAQAAIKEIQDAKPYWGLTAIKDLKEKSS